MTTIEMQAALYKARNAYLKAKAEMEFQRREIVFLKQCLKDVNLDLFDELFSEVSK